MPRVSLSSAMARHKNINSLIDMLWANKGDVIGEVGVVGGCKFSNLPDPPEKFILQYQNTFVTISVLSCYHIPSTHSTIRFFIISNMQVQ